MTADLEIDDLGNCYLNAMNDQGYEWFMTIETELGWSEIKQFGPLMVDMDDLGYGFSYNYQKMEYDQKKLFKTIDYFLNNKSRMITQAMEVEKDFIASRFDGLHLQI